MKISLKNGSFFKPEVLWLSSHGVEFALQTAQNFLKRKKGMVINMKNKVKSFFRWAMIFALCFTVIYLTVFFGGWKLFESGDPLLMELGVALVLSFFVFAFNEVATKLEKKIQELEERIEKMENKGQDQSNSK